MWALKFWSNKFWSSKFWRKNLSVVVEEEKKLRIVTPLKEIRQLLSIQPNKQVSIPGQNSVTSLEITQAVATPIALSRITTQDKGEGVVTPLQTQNSISLNTQVAATKTVESENTVNVEYTDFQARVIGETHQVNVKSASNQISGESDG
jgi:hypothetical protein